MENTITLTPTELKDIVSSAVKEALQTYAGETVEKAVTDSAKLGAEAAVKAGERERRRVQAEQYDKRFHNTKLLLRHYRTLNEHYKHAVFDTRSGAAESETFTEIMQAMNTRVNDEALYIESIKQSCVRTKIIMAHVNKMLDIYECMCRKSNRPNDARHWRILHGLYLADQTTTAGAMAMREHIDKRTVYKDLDICIADLTTLLFGIGALEKP